MITLGEFIALSIGCSFIVFGFVGCLYNIVELYPILKENIREEINRKWNL